MAIKKEKGKKKSISQTRNAKLQLRKVFLLSSFNLQLHRSPVSFISHHSISGSYYFIAFRSFLDQGYLNAYEIVRPVVLQSACFSFLITVLWW
ncbi:hypothetical protein AB3S75_007862 [Citrus x aurantiifolia]